MHTARRGRLANQLTRYGGACQLILCRRRRLLRPKMAASVTQEERWNAAGHRFRGAGRRPVFFCFPAIVLKTPVYALFRARGTAVQSPKSVRSAATSTSWDTARPERYVRPYTIVSRRAVAHSALWGWQFRKFLDRWIISRWSLIDWLNFLKNDWNFFMSRLNREVYIKVKKSFLKLKQPCIEKHRPSTKCPPHPYF